MASITSVYLPEFRPPPGWAYWSLWCVVGGCGRRYFASSHRTGAGNRVWPWLLFGVLSLGMCVIEEAICYLIGTGMWENRSRFWPEFGLGVLILMGWTIGTSLRIAVQRAWGLGGTLTLRFIRVDGRGVRRAEVLSSPVAPHLDHSAIDCVSTCC